MLMIIAMAMVMVIAMVVAVVIAAAAAVRIGLGSISGRSGLHFESVWAPLQVGLGSISGRSGLHFESVWAPLCGIWPALRRNAPRRNCAVHLRDAVGRLESSMADTQEGPPRYDEIACML